MDDKIIRFPRAKRLPAYAPPEAKRRPILMWWLTALCCLIVVGLFVLAWRDFGYVFTGRRS